jgi:hypothetical protein
MRYLVGSVMMLGLNLVTPRANAQELTDSMAVSFKEEGDKEIDTGNYTAAVEAYEKGDRIQHHPIFDFNRARALQGAGRMAEALDALERFDREAPTDLRAKVPGFDELLAQLRRSVAGLILTGERRSARVSINGRDSGKLVPGNTIRCDAGSFELKVEAEGFRSISKRITITAGETQTVELKWQPIDHRAKIRLSASVPGAAVWIDGRPLGQTPIELKLEPGRHRLRLEHPDTLPLQTEIVVAARESRETALEMPRPAPFWTRWWFWTGAAAVAAGLVVTGIALSTSKSPREGDIAPGVVSGPLTAP